MYYEAAVTHTKDMQLLNKLTSVQKIDRVGEAITAVSYWKFRSSDGHENVALMAGGPMLVSDQTPIVTA